MSLLSRFLDRLFPPKGLPEETHSIRLGAKGFDVVDGGSTATCPWGDVARIELVKLDLFAFDMICMDLTIDGLDGQVLRLNERMKGWSDLVQTLPTALEGALSESEWFARIAHPAFAENRTTIYDRSAP